MIIIIAATRRSCPAIAPAYTPPAPYELANPYGETSFMNIIKLIFWGKVDNKS